MSDNNTDKLGAQERVMRSIAAKAALRPKVDANGRPIGDLPTYTYDQDGKLVTPADPA